MTTIPHSDLIRAVLDGKVVQWRNQTDRPDWESYDSDTLDVVACLASDLRRCVPGYEFRIKPEPVVRWVPMWKAHPDCIGYVTGDCYTEREAAMTGRLIDDDDDDDDDTAPTHVLRLELDPDTLAVIDARTEAP